MNAFVGYQSKSDSELLELINKLTTEKTYYFLRWNHEVSGIIEEIPNSKNFPMLEGQMFNYEFELRWKYKRQNIYDVLLLTIGDNNHGFQPLEGNWTIEPKNNKKFPSYAYPAYGYPTDEPRFPKSFNYPHSLDTRRGKEESNKPKLPQPKLAQRYFLDQKTSTVHFVALTVEK